MRHVVLLGDSIFDNGAYVGSEPDVTSHLSALLPQGWHVTSRARDGSRIENLLEQLETVPRDASHLAVAIGGNDALANSDLLDTRVSSTAAALQLFGERVEMFARAYRRAISRVVDRGCPTIVCTIYNGNFEAAQQREIATGLALFNDAILRVAFDLRLTVVELRAICAEPADYANAIEPSGRGGEKIAKAIARAIECRADDMARVVS